MREFDTSYFLIACQVITFFRRDKNITHEKGFNFLRIR